MGRELSRRDRAEFARSVGVEPDPWQEEFLRSESKRVLLNCCRQSGKSMTTAIIALHTAIYKPESVTLVLAPAERQAKLFFDKVIQFYRRLGHKEPSNSMRKLGMRLDNGSRIEALPGNEKTTRAWTADLIVLDEAARIPDPLYYAIRPMLAVRDGTLVMLSSPFGKRGVFYEEWEGRGDWDRYLVTAYDCPRITPEFLEEERMSLPDTWFRAEWMCEFTDNDDAVFTVAEIERAMSADVRPLFGLGA